MMPNISSDKVNCPMCEKELMLTDKSWRLTGHVPPKKLEPRDCSCGTEAWIGRTKTGRPFVAVFKPTKPVFVSR